MGGHVGRPLVVERKQATCFDGPRRKTAAMPDSRAISANSLGGGVGVFMILGELTPVSVALRSSVRLNALIIFVLDRPRIRERCRHLVNKLYGICRAIFQFNLLTHIFCRS